MSRDQIINSSLFADKYLGVNPNFINSLAKDHNLDFDSYDRRAYDELMEAAPAMQKLAAARDVQEQEGKKFKESKAWRSILRDVWGEFYKADTTLLPEGQVDAAYRANRPYIEKMQEDPTTEQARLTTQMDELAAGLASIEAGKSLLGEIQAKPELQKAMEQAEKAAEAADKGNGPVAEGYADLAQQELQKAAGALRRAVRVSLDAGKEKAEEVAEALAGWGIAPADLARIEMGDRLKLAERLLGPRMKKLSDLVGRFRNLARARQKHKVNRGRDEIHGITLGRDIGRLLPAEMAALTDPVRELDFYRRYNERSLLQYELKSKEKLGRGPMVVLVDISGSMSGQPLDWAIAVSLALADTAARQKRQTLIAFFNTRIIKAVEFAPGEKNIDKLVDISTVGASGGTDYTPALELALDKIRSQAYQRADVVMVTDGLCRVPEDFLRGFLETKKALDFRAWSILIGPDPGAELARWSDQVWSAYRLTEDIAGEVFERAF
jgi:uncharacterized protein with von Willebrand factor type A (vWA) domain